MTHVLTGACLARAGCNRRTAYATITMALAAEMPDIDTVWGWRGPVEGFAHHRGITHTFVGLPFEAALLVGLMYGVHRLRLKRRAREPAVAVRWGWLYFFALLGLLSHLWLDYTNNYGLRPFFPFDRKWYAGSFVFIFDPVIFVLLVAAIVAPWLFGLVGSEVGARRPQFRGRGWAVAGLSGIVLWWSLRFVEHARAIDLAMGQSVQAAAATTTGTRPPDDGADPFPAAPEAPPVYLSPVRAWASPEPINPFQWTAATDLGAAYQLAAVDTRTGAVTPDTPTYPKLPASAAILAAERGPLGRAYTDWSIIPFISEDRLGDGTSNVTFRDLRFVGGWMGEHGRSALVGTIRVDSRGYVIAETMDGRAERER